MQAFLGHFEQTARTCDSFRTCSTEEIYSYSETLEAVIAYKVQQYWAISVLMRAEPYDQEKDRALEASYELFSSFVQPCHLDLPSSLCQDREIQVAVARMAYSELAQVNEFVTPRDKLVCISNCYRVINRMM